MDVFFWLAVITLVGLTVLGAEGTYGSMKIKWLDDVIPLEGENLPLVSVIIPALNEEENIRKALHSLLALDYKPLEIIVLNDRSTDTTGEILDELERCDQRLKVIHIKELPTGWLGKNHALYHGARQASGQYFLFSDADVVMEPSTINRAMAYLLKQRIDHVTLFFKAVLPSSLLMMVAIEIAVGLVAYLRPWKAADPKSKSSIGIGAFNLVRAESYWQAGGHKSIRLCPVDDVYIGRLLKKYGFRQECLYGNNFISVKWYNSLSEMTHGLLKNTFAALEYSFSRLCILSVLQVLVSIWPWWALFFLSGPARVVNLIIIVITGLFFTVAALKSNISPKHVVWFPLTPYIRLYMTWKAVLWTLWKGGIIWRGTFYPLKELKENTLK
jgi:glycosyltransferase involved in cell wall biosynthesis